MNNPMVAFIIANYNYGDFVVDAINSALLQDYPNVYICVVNDGSSDNSLNNILEMFDDWKTSHQFVKTDYYSGKYNLYYRENMSVIDIENSGASTARNVAIWHAMNIDPFAICILDADDIAKSNKVSMMMQKMQSSDDVGVVYADYDIVRPSYIKREYKKPYEKHLLEKECIVHSGSLIRCSLLQKIVLPNKEFYDSKLHGPLSKGFIGCTEDYDLWLRLSNHCMMYHIPQSLSIVRETGRNQSMKMNRQIFEQNMEVIKNRI